jgi:hypothetical protein
VAASNGLIDQMMACTAAGADDIEPHGDITMRPTGRFRL